MTEPTETEKLAKSINDSGFPFQIGLKMLTNSVHGWRATLTEHPWRDQLNGSDKFIDFVATYTGDLVNLVTECKRARNTEWFFLRESVESNHSENRLTVRARVLGFTLGNSLVNDWMDVQFIPGSPEANFCVMRKNTTESGSGQYSQELLEKTASEIVRATQALTEQQSAFHSVQRPLHRVYIPIIVTNAQMYICDAAWEKVNLDSGEVEFSAVRPIKFIRFRKSFGVPDLRNKAGHDIATVMDVSANTVIVVQAAAYLEFLAQWNLSMPFSSHLKDALGVK
ncbi:MAG TPA: hypothetical protein VN325_04445 [Steroidobacteraceae bacterium]|nr:hypothetical protein [Steroidobacteraceae bacterium]